MPCATHRFGLGVTDPLLVAVLIERLHNYCHTYTQPVASPFTVPCLGRNLRCRE